VGAFTVDKLNTATAAVSEYVFGLLLLLSAPPAPHHDPSNNRNSSNCCQWHCDSCSKLATLQACCHMPLLAAVASAAAAATIQHK
jgi:hypothetical protein